MGLDCLRFVSVRQAWVTYLLKIGRQPGAGPPTSQEVAEGRGDPDETDGKKHCGPAD